MDLQAFATDKRKEENGVWKKLSGSSKALVARANNPKYRAAVVKYQKEFCGPASDFFSPEYEKAIIYAMAEAILLGWENISIKGDIIEYSVKNAIKVLIDYPDFREVISSISLEADNYRPEDIAKKSLSTSDGCDAMGKK
jgi:hypothetical protein